MRPHDRGLRVPRAALCAALLAACCVARAHCALESPASLIPGDPGDAEAGVLLPAVPVPDSVAVRVGVLTAFSAGIHAQFARDHALALARFAEAARHAPGEPEILARRALSLLELREPAAALAAADSALALDSLHAAALRVRGSSLSSLGRYAEAVAPLRAAVRLRADPQTLHLLIGVLEAQGRRAEQLEPLGALIEAAPGVPAVREKRGTVLAALGRVDEAVADFLVILEDSPEYPGVEERVASLLYRPERNAELQAFYLALSNRHPDHVRFRWKLIEALLAAESWDAAEAQLLALRQRDPEDAMAVLQLALISYRRGDTARAFGLLEDAVALAPTLPIVQRWKMRLHFAQGEVDSALACADRVLAERPGQPDAWKIRAICLLDFGRLEEAQEAFGQWALHAPEDPEPLVLAAGVLQRLGRPEEGLSRMREAAARAPQNDELRIELVSYLGALQAYDEAEDILRGILAAKPEHAAALNALGYMLASRGVSLDEAEKLIAKALSVEPDNPAILDSMGWLWYKKGNAGRAEKWLKRAIDRGGRHPEIYAHLVQVLLERGREKNAREFLRRGLELSPEDPALRGLRERLELADPGRDDD